MLINSVLEITLHIQEEDASSPIALKPGSAVSLSERLGNPPLDIQFVGRYREANYSEGRLIAQYDKSRVFRATQDDRFVYPSITILC